MTDEKKEMTFEVKPLEALPERTYSKASKYDAILNGFMTSKAPFAEVDIKDVKPSYSVVQLQKRIAQTERKDVSARMINGKVYLSKELKVESKGKSKKD